MDFGGRTAPASALRPLRLAVALAGAAAAAGAAAPLVQKRAGDPYDCGEGLETWWVTWEDAKRDWCCSHRLRCPERQSAGQVEVKDTDPYDCGHGLSDMWTDWEEEKRTWCCSHRLECPYMSQGAEVEGGAQLHSSAALDKEYDCEGDDEEVGHWEQAQQEYCCFVEHKGCLKGSGSDRGVPVPPAAAQQEEDLVPDSYDCTRGPWNRGHVWSAARQEWCCSNKGVECEAMGAVQMKVEGLHGNGEASIAAHPTSALVVAQAAAAAGFVGLAAGLALLGRRAQALAERSAFSGLLGEGPEGATP